MRVGELWIITKETLKDWSDDEASRLAASLAFYTLLSLAPLLVIVVAVAGMVLGPEAARGQIETELGTVVGRDAAEAIQTVLASARSKSQGAISAIIGVVTLFLGASGVFGELQYALNRVWDVKARPGRGILGEMKDRFFSFTVVLGVAFLLLVSLVLSAVVSALGRSVSVALPGGELVWQLVNFAFSLAMVTVLFALIYRYVPDVEIVWRDVWVGAAVTALLFTIGKSLLGLYLGKASVGSSYGAAGSLVVLIVWVYYSAQILFLGAEFTQVQARHRGRELKPKQRAVPIRELESGRGADAAV